MQMVPYCTTFMSLLLERVVNYEHLYPQANSTQPAPQDVKDLNYRARIKDGYPGWVHNARCVARRSGTHDSYPAVSGGLQGCAAATVAGPTLAVTPAPHRSCLPSPPRAARRTGVALARLKSLGYSAPLAKTGGAIQWSDDFTCYSSPAIPVNNAGHFSNSYAWSTYGVGALVTPTVGTLASGTPQLGSQPRGGCVLGPRIVPGCPAGLLWPNPVHSAGWHAAASLATAATGLAACTAVIAGLFCAVTAPQHPPPTAHAVVAAGCPFSFPTAYGCAYPFSPFSSAEVG